MSGRESTLLSASYEVRLEMFKADPICLWKEVRTIIRVHGTSIWHWLLNIVKLYTCVLLIGKQLLETDKDEDIKFVNYVMRSCKRGHISWKKSVFTDKCRRLQKEVRNRQNYKFCSSQCPDTQSPRNLQTLIASYSISGMRWNETMTP